METYLSLDNGLHTDFEPINQPTKTYKYALNTIRQLSGAIENELGTTLTKKFDALYRRIIGTYNLNDDIIICSCSTTESEIGVLDSNKVYTVIRNNTDLNFTLGSIIKMEGKKNFKGQRIICLVEKGGSNPIRYINIDDQDLLTSSTFSEDIKIQVTPFLPTITVNSVVDGGSLPTGVYQASVRLLTSNTNGGVYSTLTPLVSIIDDSSELDYTQQDGAPPQSNSSKAIIFSIDNIDTAYSFIEVIILSYIGTANIPIANVVARLPIDNRQSIRFTYSSIDQNKQSVDLEAITIKPTYYDTAEDIAQKDGILTLGNLTSKVSTYNFQEFANTIKVKYIIEEIPFIPGYKDPILAATKRGYQRDEVYSFAIVPNYKGSSNEVAYHIPSSTGNSIANVTTKELGTYVSDALYPEDKDYPAGNVTHHRMPSMNQEPILSVRGSQVYLRVLGIQLEVDSSSILLTDEMKKDLLGFHVVRQIRKDGDKSIVAQGIGNIHFKCNTSEYKFLSPLPKYYIGNNSTFVSDSKPFANLVGFYSPETVIYQSPLVGNLTLKTVAQLEGKQEIIYDLGSHKNENDVPANFKVFLDYNSTSAVNVADVNIVGSSPEYIPADSADNVGANNSSYVTSTNDTINYFKNNGYLFLKLATSLPVKQERYAPNSSNGFTNDQPEFFYYYRGHDNVDKIFLNGIDKTNETVNRTGNSNRYLYNIVRNLTSQYGEIFDATYIYCGDIALANSSNSIFGGDTFIGKFGVVSAGGMVNEDDEIDYTVLNYFFCESSINVGYRHYNKPRGEENQANFIAGTTPYYPKLSTIYNVPSDTNKQPGILNLSWALGHGRGYNKQYSFENSIIQYYPKQLAEEVVTKYENRIIYTEKSIEGEQFDGWRVILPNNYHDIPKDKGAITELFVHNHRYYIHTSGALYLASFNDKVSMNSSIGETYLGNGGIFNRPSEPILTLSGGYAGTTSSCGINTPYGRLFTDNLNSKVYLLQESLQEISQKGMLKFFGREIKNIADKPSLDSGYTTVYDDYNKRILLTKIGEDGWTISYSPQLESWSSFHSYIPYSYFSRNQEMYSIESNNIWQHLVGDYSIFYSNLPSPMQLDIVVNDAPNVTKTFDNLVFHTTSQNSKDIEQHYDTWNTLQCFNNRQNTGKCRLLVPRSFQDDFQTLSLFEVFAKLKSNEFRVAIPNDLVLDVNESIFEPTNLANSRNYRPSISGKWLVISLQYNNLRNNKFVLHTIGRIFRHRIR